MKKKKPYRPPRRLNPVAQAQRIDKISQKLEIHQRQIEAISRSHDIHISYLANFARHDIKNAIQNMDSILSTTSIGDFDEEKLNALNTSVVIIRDTIDNFAKLVPYSTTGTFTLDVLMVAVELLSRFEMQNHEIEISFHYPRQSDVVVALPFQAVLQMMHNLVINATKSLETVTSKKMMIEAVIQGRQLRLLFKDNGHDIEAVNSEKIFEYGYSTTGGSGIGLFHAKYICAEFKGEISVDFNTEPPYNKTFAVTLPLNTDHGEDHTDH